MPDDQNLMDAVIPIPIPTAIPESVSLQDSLLDCLGILSSMRSAPIVRGDLPLISPWRNLSAWTAIIAREILLLLKRPGFLYSRSLVRLHPCEGVETAYRAPNSVR